jgi:hypothetical protein
VTDALQTVLAARDATLAARSARLTLERTAAWSHGGLAWKPAERWWRRTLGRAVRSEGVIDFRGRRYLIDSGEPPLAQQATPLWLVDLLQGAVEATERPPEPRPDGGFSLDRELRVTVDLEAAAERVPDLYMPRTRVRDGRRTLPVDVVVRSYDLLHQVAATLENLRVAVTLYDHGVDLSGRNWPG